MTVASDVDPECVWNLTCQSNAWVLLGLSVCADTCETTWWNTLGRRWYHSSTASDDTSGYSWSLTPSGCLSAKCSSSPVCGGDDFHRLRTTKIFGLFSAVRLGNRSLVGDQADSASYPMWDGTMSTSQRAVMLCGWEGNLQVGGK